MTLRERISANWFFVAVPMLLLAEWLVVRDVGAEMGRFLEVMVLFDLCVFLPLLYVICYRRSVPLKHLILRTVALACIGVYLATYMVPEPMQQVLPQLGWARIAGLVILALVELKLLITILRMAWRSGGTAEEVRAESGMPMWVARLMVLEARFWKALWRLIRGR